MAKTNWEVLNTTTAGGLQSTDQIVEILLENRGITSKKAKKEFLGPKHPGEISPKEVGIDEKEVKKAVNRIKKGIQNNEQIVVYGDYDADGICASAVMWEALDSLGARATPFIPDRFEDGYGINKNQIAKLKSQKNVSLIITVDNGIVAYEALKEAKKLGIDVIITDHHTYEKKPKAFAVVHTLETSGSGVAYFLAKELTKKSEGLELAAIGTVADQLPLVGINRSIVKHGLSELNSTKRLGLRKLLMVSGLLGKQVGTYEVGFLIAPRINASGRIAQGMDALRLLCTRSARRAESLAKLLNDLNTERQDIVESAVKLAEENSPDTLDSVIVMSHEEYHEGVIGLIAGKVAEKYSRPAIVMSLRGEMAKASARSVPGFSIISAIRANQEFIVEGGGHDMAAGFSIETRNIEIFTKAIQGTASEYFAKNNIERKIKIDCELDIDAIDINLYNAISALEPFGSGNPTPVFLSKKVEITDTKSLGKTGAHKKMIISRNTGKIEALRFNSNEEVSLGSADIVYRLSLNEWNGKRAVELIVNDMVQK